MGANDPVNIIWQPNAGSQALFLACPAWECLLHGTRGGGKSDALLMDFAQEVGAGYGAAWRGVLFRRSYKQLADIVARTRKWFPLIFPKAKFNESDLVWKFETGEQLLLRYLSRPADYDEYHGWEIPWLGYDELTTHPTSEAYEKMKMCSRSSMPGMPRRIRATTNPMGVGHNWVKHYFVDPAPSGRLFGEAGQRRCHIFSSLEENPALMLNDPEYIKKLESIADPNLKKAWRYGSWDVVSGGMFDDLWRPDVHVISPFKIPKQWHVDRSFDWGSSAPFSVGWWAQSDGSQIEIEPGKLKTFPKGTLFRIAEWYGWNGEPNEGVRMIAPEIARGVLEREKFIPHKIEAGPADTAIFDVVNGTSIADQMGLAGVSWKRADKSPGSRVARWEKMRTYLHNALPKEDGTPMEGPGLFIFETCRQFIRTVPVLPRDEKKIDDIDTAAEDHIADETGYRILAEPAYIEMRKLKGL